MAGWRVSSALLTRTRRPVLERTDVLADAAADAQVRVDVRLLDRLLLPPRGPRPRPRASRSPCRGSGSALRRPCSRGRRRRECSGVVSKAARPMWTLLLLLDRQRLRWPRSGRPGRRGCSCSRSGRSAAPAAASKALQAGLGPAWAAGRRWGRPSCTARRPCSAGGTRVPAALPAGGSGRGLKVRAAGLRRDAHQASVARPPTAAPSMARFERSTRSTAGCLPPRASDQRKRRLSRRQESLQLKQPKHSGGLPPRPARGRPRPWQAMPHRSHWLHSAGSTVPPQQRPPRQNPQQGAQRAKIAAPEPRPIAVQQQRDHEDRQDQPAAQKRLLGDGEDVVAEDVVDGLGRPGSSRSWPTPGSALVDRAVEPSSTAHWRRAAARWSCCGRGARADRRRTPNGRPDGHHQEAGQQVVLGPLPGRPMVAALASAPTAVEDPAGQGVDRSQRTDPAAEHAAHKHRDDHDAPATRAWRPARRGPTSQVASEQQRIDEEEQLSAAAGPLPAVRKLARHQQAEKQQQKQRPALARVRVVARGPAASSLMKRPTPSGASER